MTYFTQQTGESETRLNLALLCLALCSESISRPDPAAFLQEQMIMWNEGSRMWLHTLLESEGNDGFLEASPQFQDAHLSSTPEQTVQKQAVPACLPPNSPLENE